MAVIVSDGFEQVEFDEPVKALREAGATVEVLAEDERHLERIKGLDHVDPAQGTQGDRLLEEASPRDYDALLIPGGAISPDAMRASERHLDFVRGFHEAEKPIFAICHGPWLLGDAGIARDRRVTSWPNIRPDLERAGADWVDQVVVVDGNLVTSRKPDDIPAFVDTMLETLARPELAESETSRAV